MIYNLTQFELHTQSTLCRLKFGAYSCKIRPSVPRAARDFVQKHLSTLHELIPLFRNFPSFLIYSQIFNPVFWYNCICALKFAVWNYINHVIHFFDDLTEYIT